MNIFQEGNPGFKATISLNKKKVHQGDVSFYIKNVDLISLKQKYNHENTMEKNDRNRRTQTSAGYTQASWHQ
jgi:hypothetical protein